jgi:hypothetical protein
MSRIMSPFQLKILESTINIYLTVLPFSDWKLVWKYHGLQIMYFCKPVVLVSLLDHCMHKWNIKRLFSTTMIQP